MQVRGMNGESVYVKTRGDKTAIAASVDPAWRADPVYMTPSQLRALIGTLTIALQRTSANTGKRKATAAGRQAAKK